MILHLLVLFYSTLSFSVETSDGTNVVGNGGHGIIENGRVFSFDLYEHNLHLNPYSNEDEPSPEFKSRVRQAIPFHDVYDSRLSDTLAAKMQEINSLSPSLALALLKVMGFYRWEFSSKHLARVDDENLGKNHQYKDRLIQLAVRSHYLITIDREYFEALDESNKVALIIHEAAHALIKPEKDPVGGFYFQDAKRVRAVVASLFTNSITPASLIAETEGYFPTGNSVLLESKQYLVLNTKVLFLEDSHPMGAINLPDTGAEFMRAIEAKLSSGSIKEIDLVGQAEQFFFQPQVYVGKSGNSHWYLGFSKLVESKQAPQLKIIARNAASSTVLPLEKDSLTLVNMCGDNLTITLENASEMNFSYALPCLNDWVQNPAKYY